MARSKYVVKHTWPNGMSVSTRVFRRSKNNEPSDVIELSIKPGRGNGDPAKYFLNVVDAIALSHALTAAASVAIIQGTPIEPSA